MARTLAEIEQEIRRLARPEQERLLRTLLEELGGPGDPDADRAWLEEVQRRSAEFDAGSVKSTPAEEVFERVRARLRQ
ncbi:MAG TPA: addiction module protein [Povalibacter sp.]|nr:addiction module protein [Povalibacter sp.]